jgi:hypothetical protein
MSTIWWLGNGGLLVLIKNIAPTQLDACPFLFSTNLFSSFNILRMVYCLKPLCQLIPATVPLGALICQLLMDLYSLVGYVKLMDTF